MFTLLWQSRERNYLFRKFTTDKQSINNNLDHVKANNDDLRAVKVIEV